MYFIISKNICKQKKTAGRTPRYLAITISMSRENGEKEAQETACRIGQKICLLAMVADPG